MKRYIVALLLVFGCLSCSEKEKEEMGGGGNHPDDTYFDLVVNGVEKKLPNIHYARQGTVVHLGTWGKDGFPNLNVTLTTATEDDFRGVYNYHYDMSPQTNIILYGLGNSDGYESHYWDCPGERLVLVVSPGSVTIDRIERSNGDEFISGHFSVTQYQPQGDCPYVEVKEIKITAKFRLKRAR